MLVTARAIGYAVHAAQRLQPVLRDRTFAFCQELRSLYTSCPDLSTWEESFITFNQWTFELHWTIVQRPAAENFKQKEPNAHPFTSYWYSNTQPETETNHFIRVIYGKAVRIRNPATHHLKIWKGVEVYSHSFLTSLCVESLTLQTLYPNYIFTSSYRLGGWVGSWANFATLEKRKKSTEPLALRRKFDTPDTLPKLNIY
jgi:hypothetical protein